MDRSVSMVPLQLGGAGRQKVHGTAVLVLCTFSYIFHISTTRPKRTVALPHGHNIGPICLWQGLNFGPTWTHPGSNLAQLGSQLEPRIFHFFEATFPMIMWCLHWAQLGTKLPPEGPKLRLWMRLGLPCASHGFNLGPLWIALGPTSAWFGANLGPSWAPLGGSLARAKLGSCKAMLRTLGLFWAQLRSQMLPDTTKLRTLSPTCVQTCPSSELQLIFIRDQVRHPLWQKIDLWYWMER